MFLHPEDMSCPLWLCLNEEGLNAGDHWFKDLYVSDKASPMTFLDGIEAALMEMLKEAYGVMVSNPELHWVELSALL